MSRQQDRYNARPRSLTSHYASSPSMLSSMLGAQYSPYTSNNYSSYGSSAYRNYNPYKAGLGRPSSSLGIYGGTSSGYGGVYLSGATLGSLNLMTPVLKKLDKKLLASQKNFKPKSVPPAKVQDPQPEPAPTAAEPPPARPQRKSRPAVAGPLRKERSRSLSSLDSAAALDSRSLSVNSLASDGYCSGAEASEAGEASEGGERSEAAEAEGERDFRALYEAAAGEVRRLRALLAASDQQLREARTTIARLSQVNQNSLSEIEKREKRAMERKLSEMEEELKYQQVLQAENQRLKDENGALIRVISKLSK